MSSPTQLPETPPSSEEDQTKRKNQGSPYTLRNIQILDGLILAAIIAVFSAVQETNGKVDRLLAEKAADERSEARDPPVRQVRYEMELNAVRDHIKAVDGRVTDLEKDKRGK
jgi:hypothetical protein